MAQPRISGPYVWVTWVSRLLVGESSCEWGSWFKAQHDGSSWQKVPSDFDQVQWLMKHAELLEQTRSYYQRQGYQVSLDSQNAFTLRGNTATLSGRPDLVATRDNETVVVDVKVGQPSAAGIAQVLTYMYALPRAQKSRYGEVSLSGQVVYPDGPVDIPAEAVNDEFVGVPGEADAPVEFSAAAAAGGQLERVPLLPHRPRGLSQAGGGRHGAAGGSYHRFLAPMASLIY